MKIRAAVLEEFGRPLNVTEVDLAEPGPGEALVRLRACGVCHTDMYTASGVDPSGYAPTVLGHEGAGFVERVGEGVNSVAPGDLPGRAAAARLADARRDAGVGRSRLFRRRPRECAVDSAGRTRLQGN